MKFVRLLNAQGRTYPSYTDYWSLVALSGFQHCEENEVLADSDETYIVSPPTTSGHAIARQPRRSTMICWQLERPPAAGPPYGFADYAPEGYDQIWVSDAWVADQLRMDPRVKYVPIGGHPLLGRPDERAAFQRDNPDQCVDFTHQAYIFGRRQRIIAELSAMGYTIGEAGWGAERDEQLKAARFGLCMHQDSLPIIEPLRMTLFACWGLPLIAEPSHSAYPYRVYGLDQIQHADGGDFNRRLLTEHLTFRKCVERALS